MSSQLKTLVMLAALALLMCGCGGDSRMATNKKGGRDTLQHDMAITGTWSQSTSYTSGEYSFATQESLVIQNDGNWQLMESRVVGGGPVSSIDSGGGTGVQAQGQWRTQEGVIYINEGPGWMAFAGYYVEGHKMLLKFQDGSRQVWYRR